MKTRNFFAELKRRNVYRVAVAYIVACWALAQGIAQVLPVFDVSTCAIRLIVILIIIGFPVAVVLAWVFEITPEGIKRTIDTSQDEAPDIVRHLEARDRQQFVRGYLCALICAGLVDKTKAIDHLNPEHLNHNSIDTAGIAVDLTLEPPRGDPGFETLADKTPEITRPRQPIC